MIRNMGYIEIGYCVATLLYIWILLIPLVGVFRRRFLKNTFYNGTALYELSDYVEKGDLNNVSIAEISLTYILVHILGGAIISGVSIIFYPVIFIYILVSIIFKNKLNKK
jgi:hypothetical protein